MPTPSLTGPDAVLAASDGAVLIVGASARAAAFSAIRAGLTPVCIDQFADVDLRKVAQTVRVEDYPAGIPAEVARLPNMPVMYTGAMENHPQILREISADRKLLGNDEQTLMAVRDPQQVHDALQQAKVPRLSIRAETDPPLQDGKWLLKPRHRAGGRGIAVWDESAADSPTLREPHYFQHRAEGETISAVFVAQQDPFGIRYVGLTHQLVGLAELNAAPFAWCGSIGPAALDVGGEILVRRTGSVLAHRFGLRGLFGCDFVIESPDRPLLMEINPRYTASVEILEILCGTNLLSDHCRTSGMDLPTTLDERILEAPSRAVVGKVVLFARRDTIAPDTSSWIHMTPLGPVPALADIPEQGTPIPQGSPVCTVIAASTTADKCLRYLLRRAAEIDALL